MNTLLRDTPFSELGFRRIAVSAPALRVADVSGNTTAMVALLDHAKQAGVELVLFPELGLTGYTCGDLFPRRALLDAARTGLRTLEKAAAERALTVICGLPWEMDGRLYNMAAVIGPGGLAGLVPKQSLPNTQEYYEKRWFSPGDATLSPECLWENRRIPCGVDLLFSLPTPPTYLFGVELCEDLWTANPPSGDMALAGALLLLNPSASVELLGKADYRRDLVRMQSARCLAAYAYAGAGPGESTADVVFSGASFIMENGVLLAETDRFSFASTFAIADVDCDRLALERMRNASYLGGRSSRPFRRIPLPEGASSRLISGPLRRPIDPRPFVPADPAARTAHCREIFAIQSTGLEKRLRHTGLTRVVIGLSGGLDSTLALLVCLAAFDAMGISREGILALTMPGLGTSDRTRHNASRLAALLGTDFREIPIGPAVLRHFEDIGHDPGRHDITFENSQARERTQILMDVANQIGGLVVGTGDLSESALGWCTFNGDHMSMYHVNSGVPKTLVRYLVAWCAEERFADETAAVLHDICATPVSPELLPPAADGTLVQETEAAIGPYELHDFFLFHFVRHGFAWNKIAALAAIAFEGRYDDETIQRWLAEFRRRFAASQFKRNSLPDGPKVGSVALSPRSDWRMPSDTAPIDSFL